MFADCGVGEGVGVGDGAGVGVGAGFPGVGVGVGIPGVGVGDAAGGGAAEATVEDPPQPVNTTHSRSTETTGRDKKSAKRAFMKETF